MKKINYFGIALIIVLLVSSYIVYRTENQFVSREAVSWKDHDSKVKDNDSIDTDDRDIPEVITIMPYYPKEAVSNEDYILLYNYFGEPSGALFNYDTSGLWYPGKIDTKPMYVVNTMSKEVLIDNISFENFKLHDKLGREFSKNSQEYKEFLDKMKLSVNHNGTEFWDSEKSFGDLLKSGLKAPKRLYIPKVGLNKLYVTVKMDEEAGNSLMELACSFDIVVSCNINANREDLVK